MRDAGRRKSGESAGRDASQMNRGEGSVELEEVADTESATKDWERRLGKVSQSRKGDEGNRVRSEKQARKVKEEWE